MVLESRLHVSTARGGGGGRGARACVQPAVGPCWPRGLRLTRPPHRLTPPPCSPQAAIDQVAGLITFKAAAEPLAQWDRNIAAVCQAVNGIVDEAAAKGIRLQAA